MSFITEGNITERSLVHGGLKHYFLDEVLGPDDDITLFEYVKRNNRETGPALTPWSASSSAAPAAWSRCWTG